MGTMEIALSWLANGFSILPISYRSKRPDFRALKETGFMDAQGSPRWEAMKEAPPSIEAVQRWFARPCNLGVVTGYRNLVVIDFDQRAAYDAWLSWGQGEGDSVAKIAASTYRVISARGMHVYLIVDKPVESWSLTGVLDVKAKWGYVLAPPSIHPSGHEYAGLGTEVLSVERLSDVLPFTPAANVEANAVTPITCSDPWDAASRAVECGGEGAVASVKARMRPEDVLQPLQRDRQGSWARCPFHPDWNPSLRIYPDGHWHCFQCGAHGDVIDLVAKMRQFTNREAIAFLQQAS